MLTNLFETRNKTFLNLVKLGDYLGRSLRENVELFSVDRDTVTYLTESGYVVHGVYNDQGTALTDVSVESVELFEDKEVFSKSVDSKVNTFLADVLENDFNALNESFENILNLWETRLHFNKVKERLINKIERFDENSLITSTPEFSRLTELRKDLVKFLKENKDLVMIPEIRNSMKLSSVIANSFNLPKTTLEGLSEDGKYKIPDRINSSIYEHLCKQELVAKELVESKLNLDNLWVTNETIQKLPVFIYESDENVMNLVSEIITKVPYFALATKKQLTSLVENNLDLLAGKSVPQKDIKDYVAKIFEMKKPVKNYVLTLLNEKYGTNIQTLTDQPTFQSLAKTQVVIFEALSKLSPKNSIMKKVLHEMADMLKTKNGVETIDVSMFLDEVFKEAKYTKSINETSLMNYLNFDQVADDLGKIGAVLKMIKANMGGGGGMPAAGGIGAIGGAPQAGAMGVPGSAGIGKGMMDPEPMGANPMEGEGQYEPDGGELAGMEDDEVGAPQMGAEDAAAAAGEELGLDGGGEEGGMEGEMGMAPEEEEAPVQMEQGDLVDNLKELEALIATLKDEIGMSDGPIEGEGGGMPPMDGEPDGDEGLPPEMGDGDGDEGGEPEFGGEEEGGEPEEESEEDDSDEPPAKFKKK